MNHFYLAQMKNLEHSLGALLADIHHRHSPEHIHQIRIAARKLRVAVYLVRKSGSKLRFNKLDRELKHLYRRLGATRELDVAIQNANRFQLKIPRLAERGEKAERKSRAALHGEKIKKLMQLLHEAMIRMKEAEDLQFNRAFKALRKEVKPWLKCSMTSHREAHRMRLEVKRLRYSLEMVTQAPREIVELQKHLGEARDLILLQKWVGPHKKISKQLKREEGCAAKLARNTLRQGDLSKWGFGLHQL